MNPGHPGRPLQQNAILGNRFLQVALLLERLGVDLAHFVRIGGVVHDRLRVEESETRITVYRQKEDIGALRELSQALMNNAPDSQEVIQLNAEAFEKQGD